MGLQDRDYFRAEPPPPRAVSFLRANPRTVALLGVLLAVQAIQWKAREWVEFHGDDGGWVDRWWLSASALWHGRLWTPFTAALCHDSVLHLAVVGVGLALCGMACERERRNGWFLLLPVTAALGHAGVILLGGHDVPPTAGGEGMLIGWATALLLHPGRSAVQRRSAWLPLAVGVGAGIPLRIAFSGHWSMVGLLAAAPVGALAAWGVRARKRSSVARAGAAAAAAAPSAAEPDVDLDALLARVSEVGMDGLTADERQALEHASSRLRTRRGY